MMYPGTQGHIVENLLSIHHGFKVDLILRYQKFYNSLLRSPSHPVRLLAALNRYDMRTTCGRNLASITKFAGVDPLSISRAKLLVLCYKPREVLEEDNWVLEDLNDLIGIYLNMKFTGTGGEEEQYIKETIDCL